MNKPHQKRLIQLLANPMGMPAARSLGNTMQRIASRQRCRYSPGMKTSGECDECNNTGRQPDSPYPCAFCAPATNTGPAADYATRDGMAHNHGD